MEADSCEKKNKKDTDSETEPPKRFPGARNVLSTTGLRRRFCDSVHIHGKTLRESILAYNKCVLLYIGPLFYITYIIIKAL
jgi:hypothetical protein